MRLQHVRVGGKLFTTEQWVAEFGQRLADADTAYFDSVSNAAPIVVPDKRRRTKKERDAAVAEAMRQLKEMGV